MPRTKVSDSIELSGEMLIEFQSAYEQSGCGANAAFKYLKIKNLLPENTKLTAGMINNWISNPPKRVRQEEFSLAMQAFKGIVKEPSIKNQLYADRGLTITYKQSSIRREITSELVSQCKKLSRRSFQLGLSKVAKEKDVPTGFNATLINEIAAGKRKTVHINQLEFLEALFEYYGIH